MKVILLKDVAKIGRRFSVVDVSDGFALNNLIPKKMASFATAENLKRIQAVASKQKEHQAHDTEAFEKILMSLKDVVVNVPVEANAEGTLFEALKGEAVAEAIRETAHVTVTPSSIVFLEPIKVLGEHAIELVSGTTRGAIHITLISKSK